MVKRVLSLLLLTAIIAGCQNPKEPRLRISSYFGAVGGMSFVDPNHLGTHNYAAQSNENNGLVYTCRGGFIDIGHVREAADRTAYVYRLLYHNMMSGKEQMSFRVIEPSLYKLDLYYPPNWYWITGDQRQAAAHQAALKLGSHIAHLSLIWHEIITWYGFASTGLFSEQISSFSWEDTYSDALGVLIAVQALDQVRPFDEAMTELLKLKLNELQIQSPHSTSDALKQVEGDWFEGGFYFFVKMNKRNFDVGQRNGEIFPWLVPGICPNAIPQPCPVPWIQSRDLKGFSAELTLDPLIMEKTKIYDSLAIKGNQPLKPVEHFPKLLKIINLQARRQTGPNVDVPTLLLSKTHKHQGSDETN